MGRAIDMEKKQVDLERMQKEDRDKLVMIDRRLVLLENALEEMVQTRVHHVDLTEMHKEEKPREIVVTKSRKKTKKATATT